jgi:NADH-quinone oxidoreductase subunit J
MVMASKWFAPGAFRVPGVLGAPTPAAVTNTQALGQLIYTKYVYFFQAAGLILLVAMIGAIVLTLRSRENVKRQDIGTQNARNKATAMDVVRIPSGGYTIPDKAAAAKDGG